MLDCFRDLDTVPHVLPTVPEGNPRCEPDGGTLGGNRANF